MLRSALAIDVAMQLACMLGHIVWATSYETRA